MKEFNFRAYSASEKSLKVAEDLARNCVSRIVVSRVHDDEVYWYTFDVDDELLARLRRPNLQKLALNSVEKALDLHEYQRIATVTLDSSSLLAKSPEMWAFDKSEPQVVVGDNGEVRALVTAGGPLPPDNQRLYAGLSCDRTTAEPDVEMEFNLALGKEPQLGFGAAFPLKFPNGKEQIAIHAEISTSDFSKPAGTVWYKDFTVNRDLVCSPENWTFKARGLRERPRYSLSVDFSAEGLVLGSIALSLPRDRGGNLPGVSIPGLLDLPSETGAAVHVRITKEPGGVVFNVSVAGQRQMSPIPSEDESSVFDYFFERLSSANTLKEITGEISLGLMVELPDALKDTLAQFPGATTLFSSKEPLAPFELLQLKNGELLGVERPVSRWVTSGMDNAGSLKVARVGCIRPTYAAPDDLPQAIQEEALLARRFKDNLSPAADKQSFEALMNHTDIDLLHFAGHADGNPAHLRLEDDRVLPSGFSPSLPLFQNRHPFFFLNACRTAVGVSSTPAIMGNFARFLLATHRCCGVVAPYIKVNTFAALKVAELFYDQTLGSGVSVDAALQEIRKRALEKGVPEEQRASMLSYLGFARPGLKLA